MVGIIFIGDISLCPYLSKYVEICETLNMDYEVLFWNRSNEVTSLPDNYLSFKYQSNIRQSKITKVLDFLKYKQWLDKQLKTRKYDKLIILTTLSGILLYDILKKYKGKYIFDIRDYSYEHIKVFYNMEQNIIKNSYFTCISSTAFQSFLPEHNYVIAHNMQTEFLPIQRSFVKKQYGETLNLVWNGFLRYFNYQTKIIYRLKNDPRFNMIYYGWGPDIERYKQFCDEHQVRNIQFMGRYQNSEKPDILRDADVLNNAYGTHVSNEVLYLMSNRYYDGLIFKIPQMVEDETYKCTVCQENGIGFPFTDDENFADRLYDWYFSIEQEDFDQSCRELLDEITMEIEVYEKRIKDFLKV